MGFCSYHIQVYLYMGKKKKKESEIVSDSPPLTSSHSSECFWESCTFSSGTWACSEFQVPLNVHYYTPAPQSGVPTPPITIWASTHIHPNVSDISASTCPKKKNILHKNVPFFSLPPSTQLSQPEPWCHLVSSLASSSLLPPVYINHPDLSILPLEYFSEFSLLSSLPPLS